MAYVQLLHHLGPHGIVLRVSFLGKIYEEHYTSKLLFSWPQVGCQDDFPIRGSRVVFASYRDRSGQASF
ncbi:hypothetical protein Tsubulata_033202 [Turnera subulata]|uniref:Poor homologous synapsis 1 PH domain-containing protein n=1 Tax=Turnera subulata TaxID=218843 RepID=A0A9Q0JFC0_9ROSI|nr:hypothetical protein Tsubulata_033202 [Turnera subulata]